MWGLLLCFAILILGLTACALPRTRRQSRTWFTALAFRAPRPTALVVIAHPDDEAMFFVPSIQALTTAGFRVSLLCLSTGNAAGLGAERRSEVARSAAILRLQECVVVDDPALQDGMETVWDHDAVSARVQKYAKEHGVPGVVVTFDQWGVSGHPNHRAVHAGVAAWAASCRGPSPPLAFALRSEPLLLKFIAWARLLFVRPGDAVAMTTDGACGSSTPRACMRAHASQLVWYRHLFLAASQYAVLNTWEPL